MARLSFVFHICLFILSCNCIMGQCPVADLNITNQNEVDKFPQNFPNCHRLSFSIFIKGASISNLDSLLTIDTIDHTLQISDNLLLSNIDGLKNLHFVEDFVFENSPLITKLDGLKSLTMASNSFVVKQLDNLVDLVGLNLDYTRQFLITNCQKLKNLNGLDKLNRVSTFEISSNENLQTFSGINTKMTFGDHFTIIGNSKLIELANFENLSVIYDFRITNNPLLKNLDGLGKLNTIYFFEISNNASLEQIDHLSGLTTVNFWLKIEKNDKLSSISGIENVNPTLIDSMAITNNPKLGICNVKSVCDYLKIVNSKYTISNNDDNCKDRETIISQCTTTKSFEEKASEVAFFPNPSTEIVHIKGLNPGEKIALYSMEGQLIKFYQSNGTDMEVNVGALTNGVYYLKFYNQKGQNMVSQKLMVNH